MNTTRPTLFAGLLRAHRRAAGLTQAELATLAGLSERGLSDLERGTRRLPHPDTVQRLANALVLSWSHREALVAAARTSRSSPPLEHSRAR